MESLTHSRTLRRTAYAVLIVASLGNTAGRILSVRSSLGKTPLLSANDRSRWCAVRALVDQGVHHIDDVIFDARGKRNREWYTIDMVRHRGPDGREHYYSSKPPLMSMFVAAEYWCLRAAGSPSIEERPFYVIRLILLINHLSLLAMLFAGAVVLADRWCRSDVGRIFAVAAISWGTMLSTFAVTLNNHLPAAVAVMLALVFLDHIWQCGERSAGGEGKRDPWSAYFAAGLLCGLAAAHELPALSLVALVGLLLLIRSPAMAILGYTPGVAIVALAFFASTYAAHQSWKPPYAHRSDGALLAKLDRDAEAQLPANDSEPTPLTGALRQPMVEAGVQVSLGATVEPAGEGRWMVWDEAKQSRYAIVSSDRGLAVRAWDNWYEYERSYWQTDKTGVDQGEPSRAKYAFHVLIGHHGIFSLTPIWLLSVVGLGVLASRNEAQARVAAGLVLVISIVCIAFYIARPLADRNYGGVSCAFRWALWLAPLWWLALAAAADWFMKSRFLRLLAWLALFASALSASYASGNPWSHPWFYNYWDYLGWLA